MAKKRFILAFILSLAIVFFSWSGARTAQASCGSVSCFVVIGSQQQVPQAGLLTANMIYNYTPMRLLDGTSGVIPAVLQDQRQMILDHHRETRTITNTLTFDLNYGITDRLGIEVTIPYLWRSHHHIDGLGEEPTGEGESTAFNANSIGDMTITTKYNLLPTLRSMMVMGFGVQLPTGSTQKKDSIGEVMEPSGQIGRGQAGLIGTLYQTYELIPHRLNEFAFGSYRHTFRNNQGYQFGDEFILNAGLNLVTVPWLVLSAQVNYRYLVHDNVSASLYRSATPADAPDFPGEPVAIDPLITNRQVPNTGSSYVAFSPGFQLSLNGLADSAWTKMTSLYFYSQIPIARDSNNNLAQGTSFVFGLTRSFQVLTQS